MPEISKTYNPQEVEDKIYKIWEESGKLGKLRERYMY